MSNQNLEVKQAQTPAEWNAAKELRVRVFVEEQGCPLDEEFDEQDEAATHAVAIFNGRVIGTGRVYRNELGEAQIGRMAVEKDARRQGVGERIIAFLEAQARSQGMTSATLHAQTYARLFYERSGYTAVGEPFDEVGIEHIKMVKQL